MKNKIAKSSNQHSYFRLSASKTPGRFKIILFFTLVFVFNLTGFSQARFETEGLQFSIDKTGKVSELRNFATGIDYLSKDTASYFLSLISEGTRHNPVSAKFDTKKNMIFFSFEKSKVQVQVKFRQHPTHLTFELVEAEPATQVDGIAWGPFYTVISGKIGEVVGVVRDADVSIGMLLLNAKTLGGHYNKSGVCEERGSLALPWKAGSSLQAYSLNRDKYRYVDAMGHANIPLNPIKGETVAGSKLRCFRVPNPKRWILSKKLF